jgi:hypothetical protein
VIRKTQVVRVLAAWQYDKRTNNNLIVTLKQRHHQRLDALQRHAPWARRRSEKRGGPSKRNHNELPVCCREAWLLMRAQDQGVSIHESKVDTMSKCKGRLQLV